MLNIIKPLKYSLNFLINFRCGICLDKSFCKVKKHYETLENPKARDLQYLSNCLYYKKEKIS